MIPIWKDTYHTVNAQQVWFTVSYNNAVIFNGKAVAKPNASNVAIRLNDICADYLSSVLSSFNEGLTLQPTLKATFSIRTKTSESADYGVATNYTFYNDWSYDSSFSVSATGGLSFPITGELDRRQSLFFTYAKNGTIYINNGAATSQPFSGAGTIKVAQDLAESDTVVVTADGVPTTYRLVGDCYKYSLYYVNAYGGWDSLLIKGSTQESESYNRKTIAVAYNNSSTTSRGKRAYLDEVTRTYKLHTGWLSEESAALIPNLLGSNEVYLYDIDNAVFYPALIKNSSYTRQTYDESKPLNYEIEIEVAQTFERR